MRVTVVGATLLIVNRMC